MKLITYDADNEEPDCMRCNNKKACEEFCFEFCGPDHGWYGYKRTVDLDKEIEEERR